MIELTLIGIGTGNPQHLTRQAEAAMRAQDLILIPRKGAGKDDLAGLRRAICDAVLSGAARPQIAEFDLPTRDPAIPDYLERVEAWHDAIAEVWQQTITAHRPNGEPATDPKAETTKVGFLVWGDPSLYDSTMRIARRLEAHSQTSLRVIPGITSIQALTAAHGVPLNDIGAAVIITTGRQLRDKGWPATADRLVVMLDGECSFQSLASQRQPVTIYWTAYAGMENEINISGPLDAVSDQIIQTRAAARTEHGWIMDIYLLER